MNYKWFLLQAQAELKNTLEAEKKQLQEMLIEKKSSYDEMMINLQSENKALFEKTCELQSALR